MYRNKLHSHIYHWTFFTSRRERCSLWQQFIAWLTMQQFAIQWKQDRNVTGRYIIKHESSSLFDICLICINLEHLSSDVHVHKINRMMCNFHGVLISCNHTNWIFWRIFFREVTYSIINQSNGELENLICYATLYHIVAPHKKTTKLSFQKHRKCKRLLPCH